MANAGTSREQTRSYEVESVARACRLIRILQNERGLPLHQLAEKALLSRSTAFRLLATLQANGIIAKNRAHIYQLAGRAGAEKKYRTDMRRKPANLRFREL